MRKLFLLLISNPVPVVLLVFMVVWSGSFALLHLPTGLFPGLDVPLVNVISHFAGADPENMELLITRPIEDRIRTIPGVRRVSSTSVEGISQITADFAWGIQLTDARQLVQAELSSLQGTLPSGVQPHLESIGTTLQEVMGYVVFGTGDLVELRNAVRFDLAARLMGVEGVSRVEVLGGDEPAFNVQLIPGALERNHLTIGALTTALAQYNQVAAAGYLDRGSREYLIRGDSRLKTITDVQDVPVVSDGIHSVFIRDLADVKRSVVPKHYEVSANGYPAIALVISKMPDADTIAVTRGCEQEMRELQNLLPQGARVRKFYDQADILIESRHSLLVDMLIGAFFAAAVLFFFLGTWRAALIVTATIPISLLATLAVMKACGQSLNVITLSALTLVIGMVVDDAIIMAENILRHIQLGQGKRVASLNAVMEIGGATTSGTSTTVAAFLPLLFLGGIAGLFVKPFGLVVSIALLVSLIVSLTFIPMMFNLTRLSGQKRTVGSRLLERLDQRLQHLLGSVLVHRGKTIFFAMMLLGLGGLAAWLGPISILPPIDEGAILIEYIMPPGTSLRESNRIGLILEQIAMSQSDVDTVYRRTGSPELGYQIEGVNRGELIMKLKSPSMRTHTLDQVMENFRREYGVIPGVAFLFHQPTQEKMDESLSGLPAAFGVTIFGTDMNQLVQLAEKVEKIMDQDPAPVNIVNNTRIRSPGIIIKPDAVALASLGLSPGDVYDSLQAARFGIPATSIVLQRQEIQVIVKTLSPPGATLDWLKQLNVATPSGQTVPLSRVADIQVSHQPAAITRLNGQREITVLAEIEGSISAAVDRLQDKFASISLPKDYSIAFTGQYQVLNRVVLDFALTGLAAILIIYMILAMQFGSWLQPLIILLTIPVALVGAIVLLAGTQVGLDVSVGMGVLTLIGISVNNAIVLLVYANNLNRAGKSMTSALIEAVSIRLRPILITAATTIFALVPVAVNPAVGSRIFQPFAITVIGGLISATAATLVLIPVLRAILNSPRPGLHSNPRVEE